MKPWPQTSGDTRTRDDRPVKFLHRSPQGVEFEVTAEGLSAIRVGGHTLASGSWNVFNAEPWFKDAGTGIVKTGPVDRRTLEVLGPHQARVTHVGGQVVSTTDYTFDGEDVTISARIENRHPDEPINVLGFSGLTFDFDRPPEGLMQVQHISYFQAHGLGLCHPSFWSQNWRQLRHRRHGRRGRLALEDRLDANAHPLGLRQLGSGPAGEIAQAAVDLLRRRANPGSRHADDRPAAPRQPQPGLEAPAGPLSRTFPGHVRPGPLRCRLPLDRLRLHEPQPAGRLADESLTDSTSGHRRLDLREGADAFCQTLIPALKSNGGQGVILWGQGGDDPRGAMYRPDFDILPPEVEQNWPILAQRFKEAGLKLGVATRPADLALRLDWKQDQVIPINADDPAHREMLWRRFQKMIDRGCTLFYLDSFGADLEHVKLMRFLRERMGRKILCFAEHQCDAILPYSGGYSETTFHSGGQDGPAYRVWSGMENWRIYQWLAPNCQLVSRLYQVEGQMPPDFEPVDRFFYRHRITPLVPVSDFRRVPALKDMQGTYVNTEGKWKDLPGREP